MATPGLETRKGTSTSHDRGQGSLTIEPRPRKPDRDTEVDDRHGQLEDLDTLGNQRSKDSDAGARNEDGAHPKICFVRRSPFRTIDQVERSTAATQDPELLS